MKKTLQMLSILIFGIYYSQTYYFEDFESPGLNGWKITDIDNDNHRWTKLGLGWNTAFGQKTLLSDSYYNVYPGATALTPNNLATSPMVNLGAVTASNAYLIYDLETSTNKPHEKYSVYITTSNDSGSIVTSNPVYTETVAVGGSQTRTINLTPFIGQQIYISFRHYDCTNQYYLAIDNIKVRTSVLNKDVKLKKVALYPFGIPNANYPITATIKNNGVQVINNVTVNWSDGTTNHISTHNLSPAINTGEETTIALPASVSYSSVVDKNINVTVTQINGAADDYMLDNTLTTKFNIVSQNSPRKVLIEEGTGTWCKYCPGGDVSMSYMDANYSNDYVGITVHNTDPMELAEYDGEADFSGFPSMNVDRTVFDYGTSQSAMESYVNSRKSLVIPARLDASSSFTGNLLTFNAAATFRINITNANFRFAVVLVEDGVTGSTSGYNQNNYFSGSTMPFYGGMPNPVPASQMVYNHVGRMLLGGYSGQPGSVPATISDGQVVNYTFTATIPSIYNTNNMKAVLLLLNASTGEVINSRSFLFNTLGTTESQTNTNYLTVYPNPASEYIKIQANDNVDLKLYDTAGRLVFEKSNILPDSPISIIGLGKGVYFASIKEKGSETKSQKVILK